MRQKARKEQVRRAFRGQITEAEGIDRIAKTAVCGSENTMGYLPVEIQNLTVEGGEVELAAG